MVQGTGKCCPVSSLEGPCVIALPVLSFNCNLCFFHRHEIFLVGATNTIQTVITAYNVGVFRSLLLLLVFVPYVFSGGSLSLRAYLVILSLIDALRRTFISFLSRALLFATESHVAVVRIQVNNALYCTFSCVLKHAYIGKC